MSEALELGHLGFAGLVDALHDGHRVASLHEAVGVLSPGQGRDRLPQLFGDEGHDRVGQAQHGFEHAQQGAAGGPLLGFGSYNFV